jgi:hypothetical protein
MAQRDGDKTKDQLRPFLRRAQRRATLADRYKDPEYLARPTKTIRRANAKEDDEAAN